MTERFEKPTRRTVLSSLAAGGVVTLAGCLGDEDVPDPVTLEDGSQCDNCDMIIENHSGPVGQSFYLDDVPPDIPEDRENGLAHFCSTWCLYSFVLDADEQYGETPAGSYATDYSTVEYEVQESGGAEVISAHLEVDAFTDVEELIFVVDSDVQGPMGGSLVGFSDDEDAGAFIDEYGGERFEDDEISMALIQAL